MGVIADWLQNRADILEKLRKDDIATALENISRTPTGKDLADMAVQEKFFIRYDPDMDANDMALYRPSRFIDLSPHCKGSNVALSIAHELCHAEQDRRGLTMHRKVKPRENIIMSRFEEAGAHAVQAQIAWELTHLGIDKNAWRAFKNNAPSIARAYEVGAETGHGFKSAFDAFFKDSGLKNDYDRHALKMSSEQIERVKQSLLATFRKGSLIKLKPVWMDNFMMTIRTAMHQAKGSTP